MKLDKSNIENCVNGDVDTTEVYRTEGKSSAMKCKVILGEMAPKNNDEAEKPAAGEQSRDCDAEEGKGDNLQKNVSLDVDGLTSCLQGCSIQEGSSLGLEEQLAELRVEDKSSSDDDEDNAACHSLQSQTSIIAIDPPSLPYEHDDAEAAGQEGGEGAAKKDKESKGEEEGEDTEGELASRGPTAGRPTSFRPGDNNGYNNVAAKAYSTLNMDRFYATQNQTFTPPQNFNVNGFAPNTGFVQNLPPQQPMFNNMLGGATYSNIPVTSAPMAASGKRGMDDEGDNAFKYTRPGQHDTRPGQYDTRPGQHDDLGRFLNDLSGGIKKDGQVFDADVLGGGGLLQPQISMTDVDQLLEDIGGVVAPPPTVTQAQATYTHAAPQSKFDFPPQMGVRCADYDPGYTSENSPPSEGAASPGSSPKAAYSPMRPPSNISYDSGIASPYSPPDDYSGYMGPTGQGSPFGVAGGDSSVFMSPPRSNLSSVAMSPASVTMSPRSVADDLPITPHTPAMSPQAASVAAPESLRSDFLAGREAEMKDALEILGKDLQEMKAKPAGQHPHPAPPQPQAKPHGPQPVGNPYANPGAHPAVRSNVSSSIASPPVSVAPALRGDRPGKLPLPPLARAGPPTPGLPVVVVPSTAVTAVTTAPATTAQPLLLMPQPQGQAPSLIVVVNNQTSAPQQPTKKKTPVAILPRPGPPLSSSPSPALSPAKPSPCAQANSCSGSPRAGQSPPGAAHNGVRANPKAGQPNTPKRGRNPQQPKMLTALGALWLV